MQKHDRTFISAPIGGTIYILQLARRGSTKLNTYAMPAFLPEIDHPIPLTDVPLKVRREARAHLGLPSTRRAKRDA